MSKRNFMDKFVDREAKEAESDEDEGNRVVKIIYTG